MDINFKIKLATNWNELSVNQLKEVAFSLEWFHTKNKKNKNTNIYIFSKLYLSLIKQLLSTNNFIKVWFAIRQIAPEVYKDYVSFITQDCTRTKFIPAFVLNNSTYYPPANRLQNLTIKEFSFVDSLYYNWRKSADDRFLDFLCAALYRKGDYKYLLSKRAKNEIDIRKPFNKILVEQEVLHFKKFPIKTKLAIAYCYEGSRNYIVRQYPHVFPKADPPEEGEKIKKPVSNYTPFGKLLHFKIQFDPSKLDATQNLNVHDFFAPYENELIEMKKNRK